MSRSRTTRHRVADIGGVSRLTTRLEDTGRRALFRLLTGASNRQSRPDMSRLRSGGLRVLFILEDAVGDTVLTLPALRAIGESHPDTIVDVATWAAPAELLAHAPYVRRTLIFPRYDRRRLNAWTTVRHHVPYDVVVDGMVLRSHVRSRSLAMMLASGASYWIGEGGRGSEYLLNVVRPPAAQLTHLDRMLSLVEPLVSHAPERRPRLVVSDAERQAAAAMWGAQSVGLRVLMNVSTNGPERKWPAERFVAAARRIRQRSPDARFVVVGLDRDRATLDAAANAGAAKAMCPTVSELVALVATSDRIMSPDTAVCHLASAFERPLVSIHNAGTERFWPHDTPGVRVVAKSKVSLDDVSVEQVMEAWSRVEEQGRGARGEGRGARVEGRGVSREASVRLSERRSTRVAITPRTTTIVI